MARCSRARAPQMVRAINFGPRHSLLQIEVDYSPSRFSFVCSPSYSSLSLSLSLRISCPCVYICSCRGAESGRAAARAGVSRGSNSNPRPIPFRKAGLTRVMTLSFFVAFSFGSPYLSFSLCVCLSRGFCNGQLRITRFVYGRTKYCGLVFTCGWSTPDARVIRSEGDV